jgi:hypothetical protein
MTDITIGGTTWASNSRFTFGTKLAENTSAASSAAPHIVTVKNIDLTAYISSPTGAADHWHNLIVAIMKIPEAFVDDWAATTQDYVHQHPEWVINYKYIAKPSDTGDLAIAQPLRVRNGRSITLYPGDKLVAVLTGSSNTNSAYSIQAEGEIRYVVRAN